LPTGAARHVKLTAGFKCYLQSLQNFKFQSLKFNHAKVQTVTNPGEIHGNGKTTMNSTRTQRLFFDRFEIEIHASFKRPVPLQFL